MIVSVYSHTSPNSVFSMRPLTALASSESLSFMSCADMIGVLMKREALMISLIRGTPRVISNTVQKTIKAIQKSLKCANIIQNLKKNYNREKIGEKELSTSLIHHFSNCETWRIIFDALLALRYNARVLRVWREQMYFTRFVFSRNKRLPTYLHHQWI